MGDEEAEKSVTTWTYTLPHVQGVKKLANLLDEQRLGKTAEFQFKIMWLALFGNKREKEFAREFIRAYYSFFAPRFNTRQTLEYVATKLNSSAFKENLHLFTDRDLEDIEARIHVQLELIKEAKRERG